MAAGRAQIFLWAAPNAKQTKPRTQSHERETGLQHQGLVSDVLAGRETLGFRAARQRLAIKTNHRITAELGIALMKPGFAVLA